MSDLHFGVTPWRTDLAGSAEPLAAQGERAEALGFRSFWLPESHFGARGALPQPLLLLAAIAARTTRIRLATTSYLLPIRHPLQAAEVAVLDRLSNGRGDPRARPRLAPELFSAFGVLATRSATCGSARHDDPRWRMSRRPRRAARHLPRRCPCGNRTPL
jgi:hypothetical protein